ncbi:MAG: hypothetical protein MUF49_19635 [Oculatellaceae cyanobacterium Prado106]|jgi:biotin operon repressor|nr:hypothetical protein [Oculatellaceae cyanobacterium Prado106]
MNKTSTDKIRSAAQFLVWFRYGLADEARSQIRPYLDRPYQLALTVLDCCSPTTPQRVSAIAQKVGVTRETVRQVLLALKEGGMPFNVCPNQGWQPLVVEVRSLQAEEIAILTSTYAAASAEPCLRI